MQLEENAGDIKIAEAELALAEDELKRDTRDLARARLVGRNEVKRPELAVLRARIGLEKAQSQTKIPA